MGVSEGKALRKQLPRSQQGRWEVQTGRTRPLEILQQQEEGRLESLLPVRRARMAASPFAYYRGCAAVMAADLATLPVTGLQVQLCGDAHIANFGGFRSPESHLVFDISDFDETLPGPWEWDVMRLAASVEILGRQRGFGPAWRRRVVKTTVRSYREAMREFADQSALEVWRRYIDVDDALRQLQQKVKGADKRRIAEQLERAYSKDSAAAFKKLVRVRDGAPQMRFDPPEIVPLDRSFPGEEAIELREAMERLLEGYRTSLPEQHRRLFDEYRFLDGAMKVVGVGSVGLRAWVAAFTDRETGQPLVLQMKQARASVLEPYCGASSYADHGERVVRGHLLMQAASDRFLGWASTAPGAPEGPDRRDYYVRQLWNWKMSIDLDRASASLIEALAELCGWTLARAHARSGERGAIAGYLGSSDAFDDAMADFAYAYGCQNEEDYQVFVEEDGNAGPAVAVL